MSTTTLDDLLKLPREKRFEYAMALWDSLSDEDRERAFDLTGEQKAELDRRLAEDDADPDSATPWEEVRKELRGRLG